MKRMVRAFGVIGVCVVAVGCSDGHPCELTQDAEGAAVIRCPDGSSSRVLPGPDGDELAERCEIETEDDLRWITCGELRAPLPTNDVFCANGFAGDLEWPAWSASDAARLELYREVQCPRILGQLSINQAMTDDVPEWLLNVEDVSSLGLSRLEGGESLTFPNLRRVRNLLYIGMTSGLKAVDFPQLQAIDALNIDSNTDLESVSLSVDSVSDVTVYANDALRSLSLSTASAVSSVWVTENPVLSDLQLRIGGGVQTAELSGPVGAEASFSLDWSSGESVEFLRVYAWECEEGRWDDYISAQVPSETLESGFYLFSCF